ncbi:MAG: pyridoxal-phosphate dependent enzyme, partial [Bacteroidota bacterium]
MLNSIMVQTQTLIALGDILKARERLKGVALETPLQPNMTLSQRYGADILFKREDLQVVRSYKLRGAYNLMAQIPSVQHRQGVVCASAGNHAQGVALACARLHIKGRIYMPVPTPRQKVDKVRMFGGEWAEIVLTGDTFDDAYHAAREYCDAQEAVFVHPFDDPAIIAGQATVGFEILADAEGPLDYIFVPIGGGGLAAGLGSYVKQLSPETKIIGVEPAGAPAMKRSIERGEVLTLDRISKFVDGAAVKRVGEHTFRLCR